MTYRNPKWWQVYGILPLALGLFALETRFRFSAMGHRAAQFGILFLVFGLTRLWLNSNRVALIHESLRQAPRAWEPPLIAAEPETELPAYDELAVAETGHTEQIEPQPTPIGRFRFNPRISLN